MGKMYRANNTTSTPTDLNIAHNKLTKIFKKKLNIWQHLFNLKLAK